MPKAPSADPPVAPVWARLVLLLLLPLLALLLYLDGQRRDPDLLDLQAGKRGSADAGRFPPRLAGLARNGQVRVFDRENLYEYIDGHADYFIGAGFTGLTVGEYGSDADGAPLLVVNLYAMGNGLNAFGVLINEAGEHAGVEVGSLGFAVGKGVGFIQGRYYVQVTPFAEQVDGLQAAREMAAGLEQAGEAEELVFRFPDFGTPLATRFTREYYRGMDFFNNVLERSFERNGSRFEAFTLAAPAAKIQAVAAALTEFLREDGIPFSRNERNGLEFYRVEDPYEGDWFFVPLPEMLLGAYTPLDDELARAVIEFASSAAGD
jgi:hypothetical protein